MRGLYSLIVFILMMIAPSAQAQETGPLFSGAYLREMCESNALGQEVVKGGHTACQAYIAGVIDYHDLLRSLNTAPSVDFCVPNTVKMHDLQVVMWQYLKKNQQHNAFSAGPAVALGLFEKYPCPVKKKKR